MSEIAAEYMTDSIEFLDGLPRETIRNLASHPSLVAMTYNLMRYKHENFYADSFASLPEDEKEKVLELVAEMQHYVDQRLQLAANQSGIKVDSKAGRQMMLRAVGEILYWRESSGLILFDERDVYSEEEWKTITDWSDLLFVVVDRTELLPYVEAGITDVSSIESFIESGIDPMIVKRMLTPYN